MKNKLIKFLKYFDAFGETHTFRVNTEKTYNSPVGGFFCLLFLIYSFYYILYTFLEFMDGNYKTKEYDMKIVPSPSVKMSDHKYFSIAFCMRNEQYEVDQYMTQNLDNNLFYSSYKLNEAKILLKTEEEMKMKNCIDYNFKGEKLSDHQKKYWSILNKFQLDGCKCVNFDDDLNTYTNGENNNFNSDLEGVEKNSFSFNLKINNFSYNDNAQNYTNSDILNLIKNKNPKLHIYFPEYTTDMLSNDDPLQIKMHSESFILSPLYTSISEINLGLLSFTDYYSYTYDNIYNNKNKLIFDSRKDYGLNNLKDGALLQVIFNLSGKVITYKRSYMKLTEYLANTIGYLWNIILLVFLISSIYNVFGSQRFLSEKFFMRNKELKNSIRKEFGVNVFKNMNIKLKKKNKSRIKKNENFSDDPKKDNLIEMENIENIENKEKKENKENKIKDLNLKSENINRNKSDYPFSFSFSLSNENKENKINENNNIESNSNIVSNNNSQIEINPTSGILNNTINNSQDQIPVGKNLIKNNYSIFFCEYVYHTVCSFFTSNSSSSSTSITSKQNKKFDLFKSSEYFYYYYMDISNYLKMMFEFEIIKSLVLSKNKSKMLRKMRPYLKRSYYNEYQEKLKEIYDVNVNVEDVEKIKNGIKSLKNENNLDSLKQIAKFI